MWQRIYPYDIESYPNVFTICIVHAETGTRWLFEVSERMNQSVELVAFLTRLRDAQCRMLGFNNEGYDYPVLHHVISLVHQTGTATAEQIYQKSKAIIESDFGDWSHHIWESDRFVPQIDVFKIMHFDNMARRTSLKKLETAMRSSNVKDLPFTPGVPLTRDQIPPLIDYMCWDVNETLKFAREIEGNLSFRDELTERYGRNFTNFNDTKIGKQHFIDTLEASGVACYERVSGRRMPRQTPRRDGIRVGDKLCHIPFQTPALQDMWRFFAQAVIPPEKTKGFFTDLNAMLGDFQLDFGAGGIHGSVHRRSYYTDDTHEIIDVDVTSYYPSLAIVNRWYPDHLGEQFCDIYADLKKQRVGYAKGTPENAMLKLALNGVYGDSNNKYSPFYDPAYTMAITINGQLQLAWLAETLVLSIPELELIQINTDGLTVYVPRTKRDEMFDRCNEWSAMTLLDLEDVTYRSMHVRDVNNYVAIDTSGKVKRKNAYLIDPDWHQDHSSLVVPKAVSAFLEHGTDPTDFIYNHTDPFDFMRHIKVPRSSRLMWGDTRTQNVSRYHIALTGEPLVKIMPPVAGSDKERHIGVDVGWRTSICNDVREFDWHNLNRRWYVNEAEKLIDGVGLAV